MRDPYECNLIDLTGPETTYGKASFRRPKPPTMEQARTERRAGKTHIKESGAFGSARIYEPRMENVQRECDIKEEQMHYGSFNSKQFRPWRSENESTSSQYCHSEVPLGETGTGHDSYMFDHSDAHALNPQPVKGQASVPEQQTHHDTYSLRSSIKNEPTPQPHSFDPIELPVPVMSKCAGTSSQYPLYYRLPRELGGLDLARGRAYAGNCGGCFDGHQVQQMELWKDRHREAWCEAERLPVEVKKMDVKLPGMEWVIGDLPGRTE